MLSPLRAAGERMTRSVELFFTTGLRSAPAVGLSLEFCYSRRVSAGETDQHLVEAALSGDRAAQRDLARRLLTPIQREVVGVLRRRAGAESRDPRQEVFDLSQDVLVALFEHDGRELRRWQPDRGRTLESFVRLVARRRAARILGQRRGNPWANRPIDPHALQGSPDESQLGREFEQLDALAYILDRLAAHMGSRDQELFDLIFLQQRSPAEVTELLGISRGAVNAWTYRLRKLVRRLAGAAEPDLGTEPAPSLTKATAQS